MMKHLVLTLSMLSIAPMLQAEVTVRERFTYYTVNVSAHDEVLDRLTALSPNHDAGETFHGFAKSDITWDLSWSYDANHCWLTDVRVSLDNHYSMPKLVTTNERIKRTWSQWYPKLLAHERNHGKFAERIAYDLHNSLVRIRDKPSCELLYATAEKLFKQSLQDLDAENEAYDERTKHGELEGARASDYF